jgi:hypothetical protein
MVRGEAMSDKLEFKTHEDFFQAVGDCYLHPMTFGESPNPVSVEEMYQHFKARMLDEAQDSVDSPKDER